MVTDMEVMSDQLAYCQSLVLAAIAHKNISVTIIIIRSLFLTGSLYTYTETLNGSHSQDFLHNLQYADYPERGSSNFLQNTDMYI
jgi:hypothetical protein